MPARRPPPTGLAELAARVRWDRVGRVTLLLVLGGVLLLYVGPARSYVSTWRQSRAAHAQVARLAREHRALQAQARRLSDPRTLEREARELGLVRPGERSYVIRGLPRN
jgi:cell division protein FtsB